MNNTGRGCSLPVGVVMSSMLVIVKQIFRESSFVSKYHDLQKSLIFDLLLKFNWIPRTKNDCH